MSAIQWTDETWNPVLGCTPVTEGCRNCYAAKEAVRLAGNPHPAIGGPYTGLAEMRGKGEKRRAVFTGRLSLRHDRIEQPLRWRKPRRVFVNSMSDLFHEDVPFEFIDRAFAVMALAPQHSFQILTKRPERMAEYMNGPVRARSIAADVNEALDGLEKGQAYTRALDGTAGMLWGDNPDNASWRKNAIVNLPWPLPNVWLGTSVEDQAAADERIPHLLQTPAAVRFLSCEPLIGPVDLRVIEVEDEEGCTLLFPLDGEFTCEGRNEPLPIRGGGIHWVIVGGESGPKARPCDVAWIRSLVAQCRAAGVPAFFKQGGAHNRCIHDAKGGCMDCTPFDLRVREFPHGS